MFFKMVVGAVFLLISNSAFAGQKFAQTWIGSGDNFHYKDIPNMKVVFSAPTRELASAKDLSSQVADFKKVRTNFADIPKITDWQVAGSGVEEDGKQKWILMQGSFKNPAGETEKFYEIHYYKPGKSKVAAIHYPEQTPEKDVKAAVESIREKMVEQ